MTYEDFLTSQLEQQANRLIKEAHDPADKVTFDVPLFIRLLELAREDIKSDVDLHNVVERVLAIKDRGTLTMDDYEEIQGNVSPVPETPPPEETASNPNLDEIRRLAGI